MRRLACCLSLLLAACGPVNIQLPPGSVTTSGIALPSSLSLGQPPTTDPATQPPPQYAPQGGGVDQGPSSGGVW